MAPAQVTGRLTAADRQYLARPGPHDPWVPALELTFRRPVPAAALDRALRDACLAQERFGCVASDGWWAPAGPPPSIVEGPLPALRSDLADRWFAPGETPLRAGRTPDGRSAVIAWRHAASDAAGGVGFAIAVAWSLDNDLEAFRAPPPPSATNRRVWRAAARPGAVAAFGLETLTFGRDRAVHAAFPFTLPFGPESASLVWAPEPDSVDGMRTKGPLTAVMAAALARACFELLPGAAAPVTMLLPVNLRPARPASGLSGRWSPPGNFVGNVELAFAAPPSISEAAAQVAAAGGPRRYAPLWAAAVRAALPRRRAGKQPGADSARLGRTIVLNNLGAVDAVQLPGVEAAAFHGPTAVDFPSVSIFTVGRCMSVCVRARIHQGGAGLAAGLLHAFQDAIGAVS